MRQHPYLTVVLLLCTATLLADELAESKQRDAALLESHGVATSAEGIDRHFESLRLIGKPDPGAAALIAKLGDDDYRVREDATAEILNSSNIPIEQLRAALKSPDAEIAARARRILSSQQVARQLSRVNHREEIVTALCRTIQRSPRPESATAILKTAAAFVGTREQMAAMDALAAAAQPEHETALRKAVASENEPLRAMAVRGLIRIAPASELKSYYEHLTDERELVAIAAAHSLAERGDNVGLATLTSLAASKQVEVRARSIQLLRAMTSENFGVNAFEDPALQVAAIAAWKDWIAKHADARVETPLLLKPLTEDLNRGLVLHLKFDGDPADRWKDHSDGKGRATPHNEHKFSPGVHGDAVEFVGVGHHGSAGGHAEIPFVDFSKHEAFAIALWVREKSLTHVEGEAYITFGVDGGVGIEKAVGVSHFNNSVIYRVGGGSVSLPYDETDRDQWTHYALTFAEGELRAYKNGAEVGKTAAMVSVEGARAAIGRHWWGGGAGSSTRFSGLIDDVRVYDRQISVDQIKRLAKP